MDWNLYLYAVFYKKYKNSFVLPKHHVVVNLIHIGIICNFLKRNDNYQVGTGK